MVHLKGELLHLPLADRGSIYRAFQGAYVTRKEAKGISQCWAGSGRGSLALPVGDVSSPTLYILVRKSFKIRQYRTAHVRLSLKLRSFHWRDACPMRRLRRGSQCDFQAAPKKRTEQCLPSRLPRPANVTLQWQATQGLSDPGSCWAGATGCGRANAL